MALSGTVNTNAWDGRYLQFNWSASQNVTNNTSTITWELRSKGGSVNWYITSNVKVTIDGAQRYFNGAGVQAWKDGVLASGTVTLSHNADGTRSFSVSIEGGVYYTAVNCRGSGSFALNTIPRATNPTLNRDTITLGVDSITISLPRASSAFTHTVKYSFGNMSGIIGQNVATSITWTPSMALANQIPSAVSGWGQITVNTYNGSTLIGTKNVKFTVNLSSSVIPSLSDITVAEQVSKVAQIFGDYRATLSNIKFSYTDGGIYGATVKSRSATIKKDNVTYVSTSAQSFTFAPQSTGTYTVSVTVTDSRGRSRTKSSTFTVNNYGMPDASFTGYRIDSMGMQDLEGQYAAVEVSTVYTSAGNNVRTWRVTISWADGTEVTHYNGSSTYERVTFTMIPLDLDNDFDVTVSVSDSFSTVTRKIQGLIPSSFSLMDFTSGGHGIAFGKAAKKENTFECALNAEFDYDITINGSNTANFFRRGHAQNGGMPSGANLNSYKNDGYYIQNTNEGAESGNNYPVPYAGLLIVFGDTNFTFQHYHSFQNDEFYIRRYYAWQGTWSSWKKIG